MNTFPMHNGVATTADVKTIVWSELYDLLEQQQSVFSEQQEQFLSQDYRWPRDPLHTWSRVWEYPYVFAHLREFISYSELSESFRIVDLGCGVTFFPFAIARLGAWVTGIDADPICARDFVSVIRHVVAEPGKVDFIITDGQTLAISDASIDAVYCISVLEHIPNFTWTIREVVRILKPGGLFVVTFDLDLRGDSQIGVTNYHILKEALEQSLEPVLPERSVHPAEILTSRSKPYPLPSPPLNLHNSWWMLKRCIRTLLGRKSLPLTPPYLAVEGLVLRKRAV